MPVTNIGSPILETTGCKSKVAMTDSSGLIISLNGSQNSEKYLTLLVYYKEHNPGTVKWKSRIGQGMLGRKVAWSFYALSGVPPFSTLMCSPTQ